jgi:hypothetical protein
VKNFIKLTTDRDGTPLYIQKDWIVTICSLGDDPDKSIVIAGQRGPGGGGQSHYRVEESVQEVADLMEQSEAIRD